MLYQAVRMRACFAFILIYLKLVSGTYLKPCMYVHIDVCSRLWQVAVRSSLMDELLPLFPL